MCTLAVFKCRKPLVLVTYLFGPEYFYHPNVSVLSAVLVLKDANLNIHGKDIFFLTRVVEEFGFERHDVPTSRVLQIQELNLFHVL